MAVVVSLEPELRSTILEIAESLRSPPAAWIPSGPAEAWRRARGATLWRGRAGLALMYEVLAETGLGDHWSEVAIEQWEAARQEANQVVMTPSLYRGFVGISYVTEFLSRRLIDDPGHRLNDPVDDVLVDHLAVDTWQGRYELWNGLVGVGVYALARWPHGRAAELIKLVVHHLDNLAVSDHRGRWWHIEPMQVREGKGTSDQCNLGLAHGMACFISFLADAVSHDVAPKARPLLEDAVSWMLSIRGHAQGSRDYGSSIRTKSGETWNGPDGWCYGDLGVSLALFKAARSLGNQGVEAAALEIARRCAERDPWQVPDGGICHGVAGLAHLFHRFSLATGDQDFGSRAEEELRRLLRVRNPDAGIAGYPSWNVNDENEKVWLDDPGIVQGAAGVAVVMASFLPEASVDWDAFLLTNVT